MSRIARDLDVDPRELAAETGCALVAAPFVFGGLVAFCLLLAAVVP